MAGGGSRQSALPPISRGCWAHTASCNTVKVIQQKQRSMVSPLLGSKVNIKLQTWWSWPCCPLPWPAVARPPRLQLGAGWSLTLQRRRSSLLPIICSTNLPNIWKCKCWHELCYQKLCGVEFLEEQPPSSVSSGAPATSRLDPFFHCCLQSGGPFSVQPRLAVSPLFQFILRPNVLLNLGPRLHWANYWGLTVFLP